LMGFLQVTTRMLESTATAATTRKKIDSIAAPLFLF
jgi:hypothetical protein